MSYDFNIRHDVELPIKAGVNGALVDAGPVKNGFSDIVAWARAASQCEGAGDAPAFTGRFLPEKYRHWLNPPSLDTAPKPPLIPFDIVGDKDIAVKTRYALPIHFITMRALELIPRVKLFLKDETRGMDKQTGRQRSKSEKIYRLNLRVGNSSTQGVGRFLFNVPVDAELHERRSEDAHRFITPENHVLTKIRRQSPPRSSEETLKLIQRILGRSDSVELGFDPGEMIWLLKTLLALGDKWYWTELDGRLPQETGREFPAPL